MASKKSYMSNYNILQEIADNLENQEVADIDKILPEIDKASKAYTICMDRIEQVKRVLSEKIN